LAFFKTLGLVPARFLLRGGEEKNETPRRKRKFCAAGKILSCMNDTPLLQSG
jgi:hypothetical protein